MAAVSSEEWHKWTGVASCFVTPSSLHPSIPPSLLCHLLTPPKDDMEIHVSASLTMRSRKAIKAPKKKARDLRVFVTVMSIDWWQRKRLRGPRQRGAGGGRRREFHLLRQIFREETCAGILASHFSYCITLIKGLPGRSSEPTVTAASCERKWVGGGKQKNILQRCLFPDSGINCLVLNDRGHCITWKLTAKNLCECLPLSFASCRGRVAENK